ncbi:MAG: hypothetical protein R2568_08830 [Candidatus Scalindua sp.]|jgi:hypothetical protein|nr:hypothetical protein [Candidatus Scalindua sp.]
MLDEGETRSSNKSTVKGKTTNVYVIAKANLNGIEPALLLNVLSMRNYLANVVLNSSSWKYLSRKDHSDSL